MSKCLFSGRGFSAVGWVSVAAYSPLHCLGALSSSRERKLVRCSDNLHLSLSCRILACFTLAGDLLSHTRLFITPCPWLSVLLFATRGLACALLNSASSQGWAPGEGTPATGPSLGTGRSAGSPPGSPLVLPWEGKRESVYSLGLAETVPGAFCVITAVLSCQPLSWGRKMAREPAQNSSGHVLGPGGFLSRLGSQDGQAGVDQQ